MIIEPIHDGTRIINCDEIPQKIKQQLIKLHGNQLTVKEGERDFDNIYNRSIEIYKGNDIVGLYQYDIRHED